MAYKRLGEVLIAAGVITEADLERGLALQKGSKERLGTVLIANGIITEEHLMEALQLQLGVDFVDLTKVNIPVELAQLVPKNIARAHQVVPVKVMMDELYLAMSDPLNFYAMEEVQKAVRKKVVPVLATADAIEHAMQVLYGNEGAAKAIEEMKREAAERGAGRSDDDYAFVSNKIDDESVNSAPTIRLVQPELNGQLHTIFTMSHSPRTVPVVHDVWAFLVDVFTHHCTPLSSVITLLSHVQPDTI